MTVRTSRMPWADRLAELQARAEEIAAAAAPPQYTEEERLSALAAYERARKAGGGISDIPQEQRPILRAAWAERARSQRASS